MRILDPTDASKEQKDRAKQYKEKIIGKTALQSAPGEYFEIDMIIEMGIMPEAWRGMNLHDRAKILAQRYLKNMIEIVNSHYKEQDDIIKRRMKGKSNDDG